MSYEIEFITDERFKGTKKKLESMDKKLIDTIEKMRDVKLTEITKIRKIDWGDHKQWRKKYLISKTTRKTTWNQVIGEINKIQAPFYKRVN